MAVYASKADIDALYGERLLARIVDRDDDGEADTTGVEAALLSADRLIDGYVGSAYTLPLPSIPPILTELAIDIAVYRVSLELGSRTDEMRIRYDDAVCRLKDISNGKLTLAFPAVGTGDPSTGGTPATNEKTKAARSFSSYRSA